MHRRLTEISRREKCGLLSNYAFILNGEVLGCKEKGAAGKPPQSAEWKTASVTSFQIRHQADSSPRPWETTLTKIYTGDLLQKVCMGKAFGRREGIRSSSKKSVFMYFRVTNQASWALKLQIYFPLLSSSLQTGVLDCYQVVWWVTPWNL